MRTACVCLGGLHRGEMVSAGGWSFDLSHHAFDVTCMLSQHQLSVNTSTTAEWQTGVKTLPCRNLFAGGNYWFCDIPCERETKFNTSHQTN